MAWIAKWPRGKKTSNKKPNWTWSNVPKHKLVVIYSFRSLTFLQDKNLTWNGWDRYMAEKKPNRPNLTQIQINHIVRKLLRLSYFCQLSLYAEFQLPWFCLSCILPTKRTKPNLKQIWLIVQKPLDDLIFVTWACMLNFSFLCYF